MSRGRMALGALVVVVLAAWSGWASGFHHSTGPAFAAWSISLAGVVLVDLLFWQGRRGRRPSLNLARAAQPWPREDHPGHRRVLVGLSAWVVLVVVVLGWELLGIDTGPHVPHLTISALSQAYRPLDAVLLSIWILLGVGFGATRARAPGRSAPAASAGALAVGAGSPHPVAMPALLLPHDRAAGVAFWVAVVMAGLVVDQLARRSHGRLATAEEFLRLVSTPPAVRVLLIGAWTYAGWHLFAH